VGNYAFGATKEQARQNVQKTFKTSGGKLSTMKITCGAKLPNAEGGQNFRCVANGCDK
jgi:hypothetical protein